MSDIEHIAHQLRIVSNQPWGEIDTARQHCERAASILGGLGTGAEAADTLASLTASLDTGIDHLTKACQSAQTAVGSIAAYLIEIGAEDTGISEVASPTPERTKHAPTVAEVADNLFGNPEVRPTPHTMADLIARGLTEEMITAAGQANGFEVPRMDLTLTDLATAIPYIQRISDYLAANCPDAHLIFADRDADLLYDNFAISHPDRSAVLLPASQNIWDSSAIQDDRLTRPFLTRYGLSEETVRDPKRWFVVVDTGFRGSIARLLDGTIQDTYGGRSLLEADRLIPMVVGAAPEATEHLIMEFPEGSKPFQRAGLPKMHHWLGPELNTFWDYSSTINLAIALQLMPRYYGTYTTLAKRNGEVAAIPGVCYTLYDTVDDCSHDFPAANDSIVHPLAAAIVQYRMVHAALNRKIQT